MGSTQWEGKTMKRIGFDKRATFDSYKFQVLLVIILMAMLMELVLSVVDAVPGTLDPAAEGPWADYVRGVDDAIALKNVSAAEWAWRQAWTAAIASRRWDGLLAVGDSALRIGDVSSTPRTATARARQAYLAGLFRARQAGSVDGVVRAAEAFLALGDREVAHKALKMAEDLALRANDETVLARVRELAKRIVHNIDDRPMAADRVEVLP